MFNTVTVRDYTDKGESQRMYKLSRRPELCINEFPNRAVGEHYQESIPIALAISHSNIEFKYH